MADDITFFKTPADFREWLAAHHDKKQELWVGYYKKDSGKPSITWPESVDQALCYGWIDGIRKSIDDESYKIRFTPRKATSVWSAVNIKRVGELTEQGLMQPTGLAAFEKRKDDKSSIYAYEQRDKAAFSEDHEKQFRANAKAWDWFKASAPSYQKSAIWWVVSAKQEATRLKRLATLIDDSENERRIASMRPYSKS
jgi:uncharacterized protein YdeI (YjbR/CyaY-like superfamily)